MIERKNTYKYNDIKKEKMGEYDEFAAGEYDYQEDPHEEEKREEQEYINQELYNFKVERVIGIEQEKLEFDEKYKESLVKYLQNHSFKNKSNTGTVIGKSLNCLCKILLRHKVVNFPQNFQFSLKFC